MYHIKRRLGETITIIDDDTGKRLDLEICELLERGVVVRCIAPKDFRFYKAEDYESIVAKDVERQGRRIKNNRY